MRIISRSFHAVLDYMAGIFLLAAPWIFDFASLAPAMWTAVIFGAGFIALSIFTDYEGGRVKIIPMATHLNVDVIAGLILAASPWLFGFADQLYGLYLIMGLLAVSAGLLTVNNAQRAHRTHANRTRPTTYIAFITCLIISACSTSTRITGSWKDPAVDASTGESKSVLITALSRNIEVRTKLEDALAAKAAERNIEAVKSSDIFTPDFFQVLPDRDELISQIKQTGVDAILTVSLIDTESETRYVRGSTHYAPMPVYSWYGGFYSYINYWHPIMYDPGYYVTDKTYFLETNLYNAETGKLVWSAQSETVNPTSIDAFAAEYPKVLLEHMVKDGLLVQQQTE